MLTSGVLTIGPAQRARFLFQSAAFSSAAAILLFPLPPLHSQAVSALAAAPVPARIVSRVDNTERTVLRGSMHPAVCYATDNGRLAPNTEMGDLIVVLKRSDAQQAALDSFNAQQYDPGSLEYHHWLTPAEFGASYGVAESDLETVANWLESQGFSIEEIPPSRTSIRFSGTAAQVEAAFQTEMHSITYGGVKHIANTSDISIPTALTPVVAGVKALHNFFAKPQHRTGPLLSREASGRWEPAAQQPAIEAMPDGLAAQAGAEREGAGPTAPRPVYSPGSGYQLLVPYDMATIYNYKSLWSAATPINGTGQTIALAGTSNIVLSDIATFRASTGLPANVPTVIVTNTDPGTTNLLDDRMENTLDVEWSGAAAPGAKIVLVTSSQTSQTTDALYASESYIINNDVAKIMSVSYGECELWMGTAGNQEYANLWQQAYTQGIAVFVSSGDSMAAVCDDGNYNPADDYAAQYGLTVSGMSSTPYNVSVGGTDFNSTSADWSGANDSTNLSNATGYIPEIPWNDTVTSPALIANFDSQLGVNYTAEQWANYLLTNDGINSNLYDELIPPSGGSGGVSNCTTSDGATPSSCGGGYAKPSWQTGVTGILTTDKRTVPDVSFFASNGFMGVAYLICDTQPPGYTTPLPCSYPGNALSMAVGGTSVSSPVMAGVMALINQKAGAPQGNPNAVLYGLAAQQSYSNCSAESATNSSSCYFNDIDTGTIAAPCYAGSVNCTPQTIGDTLGILPGYAATTGYDKTTGLGSLNVANVVNAWPGTAAALPAASLSPSSLTFAATTVNSSPATQTVTLTNTGTASLSLSGVSITGTNASSFAQTTTCGANLAAGASCGITVTFKPTAAGSLTAAVRVADNASNSPQTVALTGSGLAANMPLAGLSATSLVFASTTVNSTAAPQAITLTNSGTAALSLTGVSITGVNASSFSQSNTCSSSLAINASCKVTVTFKPTAAGTMTAAVSFADNAANSPQTVILSGSGTAPATISASVSPTSLTFPSTPVGSTSAVQTVILKNTGTGTLTLTSSPTITGTYGSLFHGASSCAGSLAPGASCSTNFTFQPTAAGTFAATLSFNDNAPGSPQTLTLTGTGSGGPVASLSPTSLTFASTNVGNTTAAQTITLKNTGTTALTISAISLTGTGAAAYSKTTNCGATLAASSSCAISVSFHPAAGGTLTASLTVADNAPGSPQSAALTGAGVPLTVTASVSASTLSFPVTAVNPSAGYAYSPAQAVTLTNTGNGTLTFTSIALAGANPASFTQINNCSNSLAASASCTVLVRFAPTASGSLSAALVFTDNASDAVQTVSLSGNGVSAPAASLSATTMSFGTVALRTASTGQAVTLTNTSTTTPINLSSIAVTGSGAASFLEVNNCGTMLAAGSKCTLLVEFAPTAAGASSATLLVTANNPSASWSIALSGTGH